LDLNLLAGRQIRRLPATAWLLGIDANLHLPVRHVRPVPTTNLDFCLLHRFISLFELVEGCHRQAAGTTRRDALVGVSAHRHISSSRRWYSSTPSASISVLTNHSSSSRPRWASSVGARCIVAGWRTEMMVASPPGERCSRIARLKAAWS